MQTQTLASPNAVSPPNGEDTLHDLHALSDEQILEIEPEMPASSSAPIVPQLSASSAVGARHASSVLEARPAPLLGAMPDAVAQAFRPEDFSSPDAAMGNAEKPLTPEGVSYNAPPPKWLADRMNDPWNGEEARNFWQGIQQEREQAAAYRGVFAKPDDARAAADRSRQLEQIDGLYFGSAGKSPEEAATAREQLAQTLLQQDPAAFREMVFAGLRALERTGATGGSVPVGAQHAAPQLGNTSANEVRMAAYAAFEKAANEELDHDVGGAISRVLEQALPNLKRSDERGDVGARFTGALEARHIVPLQGRLTDAVRKDVEAALKNDRQLAEQVAQIISGKRPGEAGMRTAHFDDASRAQVVRLIGERAKQLVPGAARRVLNDWTQTALAAHRARTQRADAVSSRPDIAPDVTQAGVAQAFRPEAFDSRPSAAAKTAGLKARAAASDRRIDYRKLSDEQILNL